MSTHSNEWRVFTDGRPSPIPSNQLMAVTPDGRLLIIHRSPKVRSIPNVWSLPGGLHDIGERVDQAIIREATEEFKLNLLTPPQILGVYDTINEDLGEDGQPIIPGWHWLNHVWLAVFDGEFTNSEPEKHDLVELVDLEDLRLTLFWLNHKFTDSFEAWFMTNLDAVYNAIGNHLANYKRAN